MITGKYLKEKWNIEVNDARYRESGDWYHQLKNFPAAFFDANGYIIFNTIDEYQNLEHLQIRQDVHVPNGISSIPGYVRFADVIEKHVSPLNQQVYAEGSAYQVQLTRYERDRKARKKCLDHYGANCAICGFNFYVKYGFVAKDTIHVHHLTLIAELGHNYRIDPIKELRPVCANCHVIIHKRNPPYSIDDMMNMIDAAPNIRIE
jgi:hypothetical protein